MRSNKELYSQCPKHTKLLVSQAVVNAVLDQDPPGRFLEHTSDNQYRVISYARSLRKASQSLREKSGKNEAQTTKEIPEILSPEEIEILGEKRLSGHKVKSRHQTSSSSSHAGLGGIVESFEPDAKRVKKEPPCIPEDDVAPLPIDTLETRQTSVFKFLSGSTILGKLSPARASTALASLRRSTPSDVVSITTTQSIPMSMTRGNTHVRNGANDFEPLPLDSGNDLDIAQAKQAVNILNGLRGHGEIEASTEGADNFHPDAVLSVASALATPANMGLKAQVSDWLNSFLPSMARENHDRRKQMSEAHTTSRTSQKLERSLSSTFFRLARSPSDFLTTLKSGVTAFFETKEEDISEPVNVPKPSLMDQNHSFGTPAVSKKDDLLEDTEETATERQFRKLAPR